MRTVISTREAPAAIGPYSQAVQVGPFVFTSGQIAIDPGTGRLLEGDVKSQIRRVMDNLQAVLATANLTFADVVKTTIFVKDMGDFPAINETYGEYFPVDPPARSTVQVAKLPLDAAVEIEMIACSER